MDRWHVRVEEPARRQLRQAPLPIQAELLLALRELEVDPWPRYSTEGEVSLMVIRELRRHGYDIYRLKTRTIGRFRIFYFLQESRRRVLVKEIVRRSRDTYDNPEAPHIKRIIANYDRWHDAIDGRDRPC